MAWTRRASAIAGTVGCLALMLGLATAPAGATSFPEPTTPLPSATAGTGTITGTVVRAADGVPLESATVEVRVLGNTEPVAAALTDISGFYRIDGLPAGGYIVRFEDSTRSSAVQWWPDANRIANAGVVTVTAGSETANVDGALVAGNVISGIVAESGTGLPLRGVCAFVLDPAVDSVVNAIASVSTTDRTGAYTSSVLAPGFYKVLFGDCASPYVHRFRFYGNVDTLAATPSIPLHANQPLPNVYGSLQAVGTVSGHIFDALARAPFPQGQWCAVAYAVLGGQRVMTTWVAVDADGGFKLGIPTSEAWVAAARCSDLVPVEWYDGNIGAPVGDNVALNPGSDGARLLKTYGGTQLSSIDIPIGPKPPAPGISVQADTATGVETGLTPAGQLPVTGSDPISRTVLALGMILIGSALALSARPARATTPLLTTARTRH
ncbi:MAG: carboxypeptidase regulatory-like domain-containing protein [Acidimicrobiia bacterium]